MTETVPLKGLRQEQTFLFVGGCMRSGTTVLHRALCAARNANPYVSESQYLSEMMQVHARGLYRFDIWHKDQFGDKETFAEFTRANIMRYLAMVSARYGEPEVLVLKHPALTPHFLTLKSFVPQARFLVVMRDPRDVIASIKQVNAKAAKNKAAGPASHLRSMQEYCGFFLHPYRVALEQKALFGDRLSIIRYEDVVMAPGPSFQKLGEIFGLDFAGADPAKFDPATNSDGYLNREKRAADPVSSAFWSEGYARDLSPAEIGKHKRILTAHEISEIQTRLLKTGKMFGYW